MKKLALIASALVLSFTSCNIEDDIEDAVEEQAQFTKTIEDNFEFAVIETEGEQTLPQSITVSTTEINDEIDTYNTGTVSVKDVTLQDLTISISDESPDANFDFLNSLKLVVSGGDLDGKVLAEFDTIEKGIRELTLPEDSNVTSLQDLLNEDSFEINIIVDTNTTTLEVIEVDLVSEFLISLGIDLF